MNEHRLYAYRTGPSSQRIIRAPISREWMANSPGKFAERCLPLNIANAYGWILTCGEHVQAHWNGGLGITDVVVTSTGPHAISHFGCGVLTFGVAYLFRTPTNVNLMVRGIPNQPKDGIQALEGVVESDWTPATFTVNWKFTRPGSVTFEPDEAICCLTPMPRGFIDTFAGAIKPITDFEDYEQYVEWVSSRGTFLQQLRQRDWPAVRVGWQKDYFKGIQCRTHQTKVQLSDFTEDAHD